MKGAYYNELDPFCCQWLRNLIAANLITPGDVDERSIEDVNADDLRGYVQCHFFAGIGGWSYALRLAGWPDDEPVWTGSCPCQPFSAAGKQRGFTDGRHIWPVFSRIIGESNPPTVFGEQVAGTHGNAWLDVVSNDMEDNLYAFAASDIAAAGVSAPHKRQRLFWVANSSRSGGRRRAEMEVRVNPQPGGSGEVVRKNAWPDGFGSGVSLGVSDVLQPSYGVPGRVAKLRSFGNSIVPQAAAEFISAYMECQP